MTEVVHAGDTRHMPLGCGPSPRVQRSGEGLVHDLIVLTVIHLILFAWTIPARAATETLDLNSAVEGASMVRTSVYAPHLLVTGVYKTGVPMDGVCNKLMGKVDHAYWKAGNPSASLGDMPSARYWATDIALYQEPYSPWGGLGTVTAAKAVVTTGLYDAATGIAVPGWVVSISLPRVQSMSAGAQSGPAPLPTNTGVVGSYERTITVQHKGDPLTPGHVYMFESGAYKMVQTCFAADGKPTSPFTIGGMSSESFGIRQSDTSDAQVSTFSGSEILAGVVSDTVTLGRLVVTAKNAVGGQSAAARWNPAKRTPGAGIYAEPQYNLLRSSEGAELVVGLTCPGGSWEPDPAGGLSYVVSTTPTLECQVTKAGTAEVRAGVYTMSIQAAVRTP